MNKRNPASVAREGKALDFLKATAEPYVRAMDVAEFMGGKEHGREHYAAAYQALERLSREGMVERVPSEEMFHWVGLISGDQVRIQEIGVGWRIVDNSEREEALLKELVELGQKVRKEPEPDPITLLFAQIREELGRGHAVP